MSTEGGKSRSRWRKAKRPTGLASVAAAGKPDTYEFWRGDENLMTVAPCLGKYHVTINGWYWYGLGVNSLSITGAVPTIEQAKKEALNYLKAKESRNERPKS